MHELSITMNVVEVASEEARKAGATQVQHVALKIGALSGVVRDALEFAFDVATDQTMLHGATLTIEDVPVVVYCTHCHTEKTLPDIYRFRCPDCGTPTPDIRQGRELEIASLEVC